MVVENAIVLGMLFLTVLEPALQGPFSFCVPAGYLPPVGYPVSVVVQDQAGN